MPRKKRDWYPGATYHLMCRGIRRMAIFREEEDYEMFLLMVKKTMECLPFTLHSYCMMTNHIHLQITTMDSEIWKIMKRLLSSYARNFNNKYGYSGHLFDSRYTSCLIEDAIYFLEVSRYIHLNPVRAGMVREPVTYPYSSYAYYVSGSGIHAQMRRNLQYNNLQILKNYDNISIFYLKSKLYFDKLGLMMITKEVGGENP